MQIFSFLNAVLCAGVALLVFSAAGFAACSRLLDRQLALALSPLTGFAICSAVTLPLFCIVGFSRPTVTITLALIVLAGLAAIFMRPAVQNPPPGERGLPPLAWIAAAIVAAAIAAAVVPTVDPAGVFLRSAIFDHAKIAIVDEIIRAGVPAANPFFADAPGREMLAYYYLWHFSAAQIAIVTGASGWEADAALTWFAAFSSLSMMMGLAVWLSRARWVWCVVLLFALTGSLRPILYGLFGFEPVALAAGVATGFGGWLFQAAWAPNHVTSAGCAVAAIIVLHDLARQPGFARALLLAALAAASYGSSVWVGAVTFPLAAIMVAIVALLGGDRSKAVRFIAFAALAAASAVVLASPILMQQWSFIGARGGGPTIVIFPYEVIGAELPAWLRLLLDPVAYWVVLLPVEYHIVYLAGVVAAIALIRDRTVAEKSLLIAIVLLAITSLGVGAAIGSAFGDNNDLAWRGVLPGVMMLIAIGAAGVARYWPVMPTVSRFAVVALTALALFDGSNNIRNDLIAKPLPSSQSFAGSVAMWRVVRDVSRPADRVVNNPYFASSMTPWPINISWALLSNRRSCYAGDDYLKPFTSLNEQARVDTASLIERVFTGKWNAGDVDWLATRGRCDVVVFTPEDESWSRDPLAGDGRYELADGNERWRIYRRKR